MLPLLWEEKEQAGQAGSSRGRVVQYGRFLKGQREIAHIPLSANAFLEGLEGHVEVFDRMDGLQMLSMRGPVSFSAEECLFMEFLAESPQVQIKNAAFSAASRDPVQRRFATMREYFKRGSGEEYPCCLCMRVTLRDMRTGRMAVVWERDNVILGLIKCYDEALSCFTDNWFECFTRRGGTPREIPIGRLICPLGASFRVRRVEDQGEDVSAQDRLYRIDYTSDAYFSFHFKAIGESDEGEGMLTLKQFTSALQAVMTPASMDGGVRAARS
jgi:hypothetical protein